MSAWLQRIGTAVPPNDVHAAFVAYARTLLRTPREKQVFDRMVERSGIHHRWSVLKPGRLDAGEIDGDGFYRAGAFPATSKRMALYETESLKLAQAAVAALAPQPTLAALLPRVTHLVVASCTGFAAPGLDVQLVDALGLQPNVQRTVVGFMGCSAALPALRVAQQAVLADRDALVLVLNVELSSLHLLESHSLEELLSFLLFGDAATAALVGSVPRGAQMLDFQTRLLPASRDLITWHIGDQGFVMQLSGQVPEAIHHALQQEMQADTQTPTGLLRGERTQDYALWAVHAGGRTVLDAVQRGLALPAAALADSRAVLAEVGNVSSATVMFVLHRMLAHGRPGARGLALAFGPGVTAESLRFQLAGVP